MPAWRVFVLMFFSLTFYAWFLTYRIVHDLNVLGMHSLKPKRWAWQMLIPVYSLSVFYRLAKQVASSAKERGIRSKLKPATLTFALIAIHIANLMVPYKIFTFFGLALYIIPWLLLNRHMNAIRLTVAGPNWRQPPNRFSWPQRGVIMAGIPLIALALLNSKIEFAYLFAQRLDAGQTLSDPAGIYSFTIPNDRWRQVRPGTLYSDTDMELINKASNEWLVVRHWPKQQTTLDSLVDMRQSVIDENWQRYSIDETRQFLRGSQLTPVSTARYTVKGALTPSDSPLYVLTVGGAKHVFEILGHGNGNGSDSAWELIKSFQLSKEETTL